MKHLSVSLGIPTENAIAGDLELTWQHPLSELRSEQTRTACVNQFHLLPWASMAARMITSLM